MPLFLIMSSKWCGKREINITVGLTYFSYHEYNLCGLAAKDKG